MHYMFTLIYYYVFINPDNAHGDGESADSRTSQSDSLTSKPAPSSENAITSDSSR